MRRVLIVVLLVVLAGCAPTGEEVAEVVTEMTTEVVTETVTEVATETVTEVRTETVTVVVTPSPTPSPTPTPVPEPTEPQEAVVEEPYDHQCADGTWRPDPSDCPSTGTPEGPPPGCPTWQPGDGLGCEPNPNDGEGGVPGAIDTAPGYDEDAAAHDEAVGDMVCPGPGCSVGG